MESQFTIARSVKPPGVVAVLDYVTGVSSAITGNPSP
jgi:hypothetical protein